MMELGRKGHQSHTGVGIAIDTLTGLIVDYEVLSSYCDHSSKAKHKFNEAEFTEWQTIHTERGECQKNYDGSAGGMEVTAALAI